MDNLQIFKKLLTVIKDNEYISSKEMGIIDNNCEYYGISKKLLMENAGKSICDEVLRYLDDLNSNIIYLFAGLGNNGGDGFVFIRHILHHLKKDDRVKVILLGKSENIKTEESKSNFNIIKNISNYDDKLTIVEVACRDEILKILENIRKDNSNKIIVDGILGTGIRGDLREPIKTVVDKLNNLKNEEDIKIISIDLETKGLKSDLIITFHKNKEDNKGKNTVIKNIGIPPIMEHLVGYGDLKYLKGIEDKYKGKNGKILIIGGSTDYFGAPILSALSSSKIIDIVNVMSFKNTIDALKNYPNLIGHKLEGDYLTTSHLEEAIQISKNVDVVVVGCGIGLKDETKDFINEYLSEMDKLNKKLVIDADAIKLIDYDSVKFREYIIFTPHRREYEYMNIDFNNLPPSTIVLKGKVDVIFNKYNVKINTTGNCGMTKGGTGDVLCGLIGAIFCKNEPFISGCAGAFINGYSGDLLYKEVGPYYDAIDLVYKIPKVLNIR